MIYDKTAFANALMFYHAHKTLNKTMNNGITTGNLVDMGLSVPTAVNCAFSCELFLKCMLPIKSRGHRLYNDLFIKLDKKSQDGIIDGTVQLMQRNVSTYTVDDFYSELINNEKSFETWRYFHENNSPSFNISFMTNFLEVLRSLAIFYDNYTNK